MQKIIKIARDFSATPGARYRKDGKYSGEQFREEILEGRFKDAMKNDYVLVVDLDGVAGYATSFLEESFGGLARQYGSEDVLSHIDIISLEEPRWKKKVESYIQNPHQRSREN